MRAPDLKIESVEVDTTKAKVGEMLPVTVEITNRGNIHATDVNIILCVDQSTKSIKKNGCLEENVAYRQLIEAVMPVGNNGDDSPPKITLLYLVKAGTHDVVVVDPDNNIVESDEETT